MFLKAKVYSETCTQSEKGFCYEATPHWKALAFSRVEIKPLNTTFWICVWRTRSGKSYENRDVIAFENLRYFQNVFRSHANEKPVFSNSSGWKSVLEKLRFRDGFSVGGRPNRGDKAAFSNFTGVLWTGPTTHATCVQFSDTCLFAFQQCPQLLQHWVLNTSTASTEFKVNVGLQGCLPVNNFFARCFNENHGKLYIILRLKNYKIRQYIKMIMCFAIFVSVGRYAQAFKRKTHCTCKTELLARTSKLRRWRVEKVCEAFSIFLLVA